eukprot:1020754-Prymnesium_polylepis.1
MFGITRSHVPLTSHPALTLPSLCAHTLKSAKCLHSPAWDISCASTRLRSTAKPSVAAGAFVGRAAADATAL